MRALGCRQPDPVRLAAHPSAHDHPHIARAKVSTTPLPSAADKLPARPRVDQGQSGSCTWGSSSIALAVACISMGDPLGFIPSQRCGYAITRALERAALSMPVSTPLEDNGADLEDVFDAAATYGVEPMEREVTPDGRFYDIWTDDDAPNGNVNDEPTLTELEDASKVKVKVDVAPHTIDPRDPQAELLMMATLASDPALPIQASGFVDQAFMQLGPNDVAPAPNPALGGGGHAFWFSAYRTNSHGAIEFKLENSWGDSWADHGAVWVSMAFVRALWAMYVPAVKVIR